MAAQMYRKVLRLSSLARPNDHVIARNNLAEIYQAIGLLDRALRLRQEAVQSSKALGNSFLLGLSLRGLGAALWALGRNDEAMQAFEDVGRVQFDTADPRHVGGAMCLSAWVRFLNLGEASTARRVFGEARRRSKRSGDRLYESASALGFLATIATRRPSAVRRLLGQPSSFDRRWRGVASMLHDLVQPEGHRTSLPGVEVEFFGALLRARCALRLSAPRERSAELFGLVARAARRLRRDHADVMSSAWCAEVELPIVPKKHPLRPLLESLEAGSLVIDTSADAPSVWGASAFDPLHAFLSRREIRSLSRTDWVNSSHGTVRRLTPSMFLFSGRKPAQPGDWQKHAFTLAAELERARAALGDERVMESSDLAPVKTNADTEFITGRNKLVHSVQRSVKSELEPPVAASQEMRSILARLPQIASSGVPVLFLGESGVGKDVLARWVHQLSGRNVFAGEICSLAGSLLETELFGYVRGAFTDASEDRAGLIERADGGSIYLDEIADLSPELQVKLLRVMESSRFRRVGDEVEREVNVRWLASSRLASFEALVAAGVREDLLFRLRGATIEIPPLRSRKGDIDALASAFLAKLSSTRGTPLRRLTADGLSKLESQPWSGNVRELEGELERACLEGGLELDAQSFRFQSEAPPPRVAVGDLRVARDAFEKSMLVAALQANSGNASRAAEDLGVSRRHLGKLLDKHGVELKQFKSTSK